MADHDDDESTEFDAGLHRLDTLARDGRTPERVALCTELIARFPNEVEPYYERAHARCSLGDRAGAILDLSQAIAVSPHEPALFYFRGLWTIESGGYAAGILDLATAIEKDGKAHSTAYTERSHFLRSIAYLLDGQFERAEQELLEVSHGMSSAVAGTPWTFAQLREHITSRSRP